MAITTIDASGWKATYSGTPPSTVLNENLTIVSPGYDNTGAAATDTRTILVTRRLRVAGSTSLTATDVGLSMPVVAGATSSGVTNNSTQLSPLPTGNWVTRFRDLIDGSARTVEITAFHYYAKHDGRPVACVIVSASDGTNTVYQTVTTPTVSTNSSDLKPVYVYAATFTSTQMGSLNEGLITYNARIIPWVGDNTAGTDILRSILNSADWSANGQNQSYGFSPRFDVKDLTRFSTRPRCYIDATLGNNTTGRWSTNDATARGLPFLNFAGATNRSATDIVAGSSSLLTAGSMDGCYMFMEAGTQLGNAASASIKSCKAAAVIITRGSGVSKAAAIVDLGNAAGFRLRIGGATTGPTGSALRFYDITTTRSGATSPLSDYSILEVQFDNVNYNNNSITSALFASTTTNWQSYMNGCVITGLTTSTTAIMQAQKFMRGTTVNGAGVINIDATNISGNRITDCGKVLVPDFANFTGNFITALTAPAGALIQAQPTTTLKNVLYGANILEAAGSSADYPLSGISADTGTTSTNNVLEFHNTYAGYSGYGRHNHMYVNLSSPTTNRDRTHVWNLMKNCILVNYNTKHDLFGTADALRIGGWQVAFGVGHDGNYIQTLDVGGGSPTTGGFAPDYEGPNSIVGTSITTPIDPQFVSPAHVTAGPVSGAGGGNYALQSSSPALSMTAGPLLPGFYNAAGAVAPSISPITGTIATATFALSGTLRGNGALAASASVITLNLSGIIGGAPPLTGVINVASIGMTGTLTASGTLAGSTAISFTTTGTMVSDFTPIGPTVVTWTIITPTPSTIVIA